MSGFPTPEVAGRNDLTVALMSQQFNEPGFVRDFRCVLMPNPQLTTTSPIHICNRQSPQWLRLLQRYRGHVAPLEFSPPPESSGLSFRGRREAVVIK